MEEERVRLVKSYTHLIDGLDRWPEHDLAEDAVMDWFGRTIRGRSAILSFVRSNFPHCKHKVNKVSEIPAITHRLLADCRKSGTPSLTRDSVTLEGSNPEKDVNNRSHTPTNEIINLDSESHTPDNPIRVDHEQLLRAPNGKHFICNVDLQSQDLRFVEIKGRLTYNHEVSGGTLSRVMKPLNRIVLGYNIDAIHFVAYEGFRPCQKMLLPLFREANDPVCIA